MPKAKKLSKKFSSGHLALCLIIGTFIGVPLGSYYALKHPPKPSHSNPPVHQMNHPMFELPSTAPIPTISIDLTPDPKAGYNLHLTTTNFTFSPQNASLEHTLGQGHAHLYIDDIKITRLYSDWYHIPSLEPGEHTIKVTLNTNDHQEYSSQGQHIQATTTITTPAQ